MDYGQALKYIHGTQKFGWKLGLHNIGRLLELMGNPHKKLKYVHIAGTNGKGSTVSYISNILMEAGYKVGIYTSPFIQRFAERIKVSSCEISENDLARITGFVKEKIGIMLESGEHHPTEFEIITAIAFQYYYEQNCDIVVLEVGLGGRFDSTNIIDTPLLAVITTINYDHMDRLGNTLEEIAFEKAGIIKEGGHVLIYPQSASVKEVFLKACRERNAQFHEADFTGITLLESGIDGQLFDYNEYKNLRISLLGDHQIKNAALALNAVLLLNASGMNINREAIYRGLALTRWPGRFELVSREPVFLIDGAHNPEGAAALRDALVKYFPHKKITFIVGVMKDKEYKTFVEMLLPLAKKVITVTPSNDRALQAQELAIFIKPYCKDVQVGDTIGDAVKTCLAESSNDDVICAFGSLYYIGEIRTIFSL